MNSWKLISSGELVGAFGRFYNPQSDETKEIFVQIIDRNV